MILFGKYILYGLYYVQYNIITDENIDSFYSYLKNEMTLASEVDKYIPNVSVLKADLTKQFT